MRLRVADDSNTKKPALAPLLIICHRYLRPGLSPHAISHMSFPNNILGTSLSAMFATLALSEWDLLAYATSVIPVVALFVAYTLLTHQTENRPPWLRGFDIETAAWSLSLRVVSILGAILSIETYLIGFPSIIAIETLTLGLAKALTWYYLSQLVCATISAAGSDAYPYLGANFLVASGNGS